MKHNPSREAQRCYRPAPLASSSRQEDEAAMRDLWLSFPTYFHRALACRLADRSCDRPTKTSAEFAASLGASRASHEPQSEPSRTHPTTQPHSGPFAPHRLSCLPALKPLTTPASAAAPDIVIRHISTPSESNSRADGIVRGKSGPGTVPARWLHWWWP